MRQAKYLVKGKDAARIAGILKEEFEPAVSFVSESGKTFFYTLEKYSIMQNSDMAASVIADIRSPEECTVMIIISGGRVGALRMDVWGREDSVFNEFEKVLRMVCNGNKWELRKVEEMPIQEDSF